MLIVLTCTGDRPRAFQLLAKYLRRQTVYPDLWVIVDDGMKEAVWSATPFPTVHLRRENISDDEGPVSLAKNTLMGIHHAWNDIEYLAFMEDDDWYGPEYLEELKSEMDGEIEGTYGLAGRRNLIYYSVARRKYWQSAYKYASMAATMIRKSYLHELERFCYWSIETKAKGIDRELWNWAPTSGANAYHSQASYLHIGMKDMPGRKGIGVGHGDQSIGWKDDPKGTVLKQWIGEKDADVYIRLSKEL